MADTYTEDKGDNDEKPRQRLRDQASLGQITEVSSLYFAMSTPGKIS